MIKVINDFLPKPLFKYLLKIVESELFEWNWLNDTVSQRGGDGNNMLSKTIYVYPQLTMGKGEIYDKELMPLFGMFRNFQDEHMDEENKSIQLAKLKLNLYPNFGKQIKHGVHSDMVMNGVLMPNAITSVFNFHTCNGKTNIRKEDGSDVDIPSVANSIVIFQNALHYGVTQSDTDKRIVLNMNVLKKEKDFFENLENKK